MTSRNDFRERIGIALRLSLALMLLLGLAGRWDSTTVESSARVLEHLPPALAAAWSNLQEARATEKALASKAAGLAVNQALEVFNAAILAHQEELRARVQELEQVIGAEILAHPSLAADAQTQELLEEYQVLSGWLKAVDTHSTATPEASGSESEPNGTSGTADPMPAFDPCSMMTATISPAADVDFFSFSASAGDRVWAVVDTGGTQAGTSRDSELRLLAPDGTTEIEFDDDDGTGNGCNGTVESEDASAIAGRTLTATGTHFFRVEANSATTTIDPMGLHAVITNTSTLEVESNNTSATANPISAATPVRTASLGTAGDEDFYSIAATAGDTLLLLADCDPERDGTSTEVELFLLDTNGTTVLLEVDSGIGDSGQPRGEGACFTVSSTGTFFVRARGLGGVRTGTYDVCVVNCSGAPPPPTYTLTTPPFNDCHDVGTSQTVTTTVTMNGAPVPGVVVTFTVTAGPNAGVSGTDTTDASGQAMFTYTSNGTAGIDTVQASGTVDGMPFSCTGSVRWTFVSHTSSTTTSTRTDNLTQNATDNVAGASVGSSQTVMFTVTDCKNNPVSGQQVIFTVTSGPNAGVMGTTMTDATGKASFTYTGTGGPGTDTIQADVMVVTQSEEITMTSTTSTTSIGSLCFGKNIHTNTNTEFVTTNCTTHFTGTVMWVSNRPPTAQCQNVTVPAGPTCTANASIDNGSFDPDGDPITLSQSPPGPYPLGMTTVTLTVTDSHGAMSTCMATATVTNAAPMANAGLDQTVDEGAAVMLSGSGSDANAGQTLTFMWTQTGGPAVMLSGANTATATFTAPNVADLSCTALTFQLKVTDSCGAMTTDTVVITVSDVFVMADDRNGHCVVVRRTCAGNAATYCWRKPDGSSVRGPCTVTISGGTVNAQSPEADPNVFQAGADLTRRRGNARLTETRANPTRTSTIVDNNTADSTCSCS